VSWARAAIATFLIGSLVLLGALLYAPYILPPPGTTSAQRIETLTVIVTILGLGIGVFVFALLVIAVWKFRAGAKRPDHRVARPKVEDKRLEFWWTLIPTLILITILLLSWVVIYEIDRPDRDPDYTVRVIGHQWYWEFRYPDNSSTISTLWIEEGKLVQIDVTSTDVIHSFYVPSFGVKIDAVPGRVNHQWITYPVAGNYSGQCAEFCGLAHAGMLITVVVFPEDPARDWGPPTAVAPPTHEFALTDAGIAPPQLSAEITQRLRLRVWNNGTTPHDLTFAAPWTGPQGVNLTTGPIPPGESAWLNFTADWTAGTTFSSTQPGDAALAGTATISTDLSTVYDLELYDDVTTFAIHPPTLRLPKNEKVYLRIWNNGTQGHNFYVGDPLGDKLDEIWGTGEYRWLVFRTGDDDVTASYWCNVPGHRDAGMEGELDVGRGGPPPAEREDSWLWFVALAAIILMALAFYGIAWNLRHRSFEDAPKP